LGAIPVNSSASTFNQDDSMPAAPLHRLNIVRVAARLFRKQGYARTGLKDILTESGAPKGSLYHYFPDGKEQLGEEALRLSAQTALNTLSQLSAEHRSASALLVAYSELLAGWMEESEFRDGCPLATTILEAVPESEPLRLAAQQGFLAWQEVFERALLADGVNAADARRLATLAIAVVEGSLIQARVELSRSPILDGAEQVAALMRAASGVNA
jgi:TetR/AcrR family transcriptional regulator, lmrAB and yxaGH operons repressor